MAVVKWVGRQIRRAKVVTVTVSSNTAGHTFTLTGGNGKAVTYTAGSGETTTTIALALQTLAAAVGDGEFSELDWGTPSANVFLVTGPADGAPFTLSASGTGTMTATQTTAPLSPHDANDPLNYSTGALPVDATDSLVFEDTDVSLLYNADALAALELASPGLVRRASFTGRLGLPTRNANGYPEYRTSEFSVESATYLFEAARTDTAGQFRILNTYSGGAVTVTVQGEPGGVPVGSEVLEVRGLPASSVVQVVGGSVAIAPYTGQACTVLTLNAVDATVRVGPSATLSGTVSLVDCQAQIKAGWTTSLTVDGDSAVEVAGSAGGVLVIDGGTVTWRSTGAVGASPTIGSDATLDLSQAPATLTPSGTVQMYAGATLDDSAGRYGDFAVKANRCRLDEVRVITTNNKTFTLS